MNVAQFFTLATDLRHLRLEAVVDEAEIGRIRPGMSAEFTVDSYGEQVFRGTVETVTLNAQTQNNVVTYPVWISVPNPDFKLRPSMTANVLIFVSTANGVTRIPSAATRFRPSTAMFTALGLTPPESRRLVTACESTTKASTGTSGQTTAHAEDAECESDRRFVCAGAATEHPWHRLGLGRVRQRTHVSARTTGHHEWSTHGAARGRHQGRPAARHEHHPPADFDGIGAAKQCVREHAAAAARRRVLRKKRRVSFTYYVKLTRRSFFLSQPEREHRVVRRNCHVLLPVH